MIPDPIKFPPLIMLGINRKKTKKNRSDLSGDEMVNDLKGRIQFDELRAQCFDLALEHSVLL